MSNVKIERITDYNYSIHCPFIIESDSTKRIFGKLFGIRHVYVDDKYTFSVSIEKCFDPEKILNDVKKILDEYLTEK